MKRRDLLKLGILAALATGGGTAFLKIYKHTSGTGDILQYPDPTLRRVAAPVDVIDDSIVALGRQMIATLQYQSVVGFFSKAFMSRGLAAPQLGALQALDCLRHIRGD